MSDFLNIIPEHSKVILIGTSQYDNPQDFPNILPAKGNIDKLAEIFADDRICGIKEIVKLYNKEAHEVKKTFARECKNVVDTLIVYYTGHGHKSKSNLYLTTKDSDSTIIDESSYNYASFYKPFQNSIAQRKILILDCCHSGTVIMSSANSDDKLEDSFKLDDIQGSYIIAAALREAKFEQTDDYTFFTAELIKLLTEGLDNNEKHIHIDEAFNVVRDRLTKTSKPKPSRSDKLSSPFYLFKNIHHQSTEKKPIEFDSSDDKFLNKLDFYELPAKVIAKDRVLKDIENKFNQNKPQPLYIKGIGGLGKTTFAQAYTWANKDKYNKIVWVKVNKNNIQEAFYTDEKLIDNIEVGYVKSDVVEGKFEKIIKKLLTLKDGKNLIVIDGLEAEIPKVEKQAFLALQQSNWNVLVTSRVDLAKFNSYQLDFFTEEEAIELFEFYYKQPINSNEEEVKELLKFFNYHTLMIELVARTLKESSSLTATKILTQFKDKGLKSLQTYVTPTREWEEIRASDYVLEIFNLSDLNDDEKQVMLYFSVLPSIFISFEDLVLFTQQTDESSSQFETTLRKLHKKGWLSKSGNEFQMHLIIQEVCKIQLNPTLENCQVLLDFFGPTLTDLGIKYPEKKFSFTRYIPVLKNLANIFDDESETASYAHLINNLAVLITDVFGGKEAFDLYEKAFDIYQQVLHPLHPDLAMANSNLGSAYQDKGEFDKAFEFRQKAFDIYQQVLHPLHPDLATANSNLGGAYQDKGEFDKAFEFHQKAFDIRKQVLNPLHPDLAIANNNLGAIYRSKGEFDKALELFQIAFDIYQKALNPLHPSLARANNNLGTIYQDKGEFDKALEFYQKAFDIRKQVLNPLHPDLANANNNLANAFFNKKNYTLSIKYLTEALNIREKIYTKRDRRILEVKKSIRIVTDTIKEQKRLKQQQIKRLQTRKNRKKKRK